MMDLRIWRLPLRLIKGLEDLGYKNFIATPHVMEDLYPNNRGTIQAAYDTLKDELKSKKIDTQIRFAAEYLLDGNVDDMLEKKEPLLTYKR